MFRNLIDRRHVPELGSAKDGTLPDALVLAAGVCTRVGRSSSFSYQLHMGVSENGGP